MASLREIKDRIGSVKSTLKITSAMKLVASSKLRKAQRSIEAMLPYRQSLEEILASVPYTAPERVSEERADAKVAVVAVASNSSLCGAFNVNAVRLALKTAGEFDNVELIAVGRKMAEAARKAGFAQGDDWSQLVAKPSYESASALADMLVEGYESGRYSKVILVYNHFVTTSRQETVSEQFLPLAGETRPDGETGLCEDSPARQEYIFEPSASGIVEELMPLVRKLKVFTAILDSAAAEHAARTVAMQTATDNAEEILSDLTLEYNKSRQQKITAEILDLVGATTGQNS